MSQWGVHSKFGSAFADVLNEIQAVLGYEDPIMSTEQQSRVIDGEPPFKNIKTGQVTFVKTDEITEPLVVPVRLSNIKGSVR